MIFAHTHEAVLAGHKSQTRRLFDPSKHCAIVPGRTFGAFGHPVWRITHPVTARVYWQNGNTYAVQPGRGKRAIGRIRVTGLRVERLHQMTHKDALAEGVASVDEYAALWDTIHAKRGERWADNPLVVVISFALAPTD
jgi:hypothetical protein